MGFASGSISCRRFAVVGKCPKAADQDLLDRLAERVLRPAEFGSAEEAEYGWCGGRHVHDAQFSFEHNVFADALHFALRVDSNKVPSSLVKSWQIAEEEAAAKSNPSGFISKQQKKLVKESVKKKTEEELKTGKHRRSKVVPALWHLPTHTLYCSAGGAVLEHLLGLFEETFGLKLEPLSAGSLAYRMLEAKGQKGAFEELRPTAFAAGPGDGSERPEYPWASKGPEPKDFVGNEFLMWLWHEADTGSGVVETAEGEVTVFLDRSLDLDCAYGQTGKDAIRGDGPSRSPEAKHAIRIGKVARKAGLTLHAQGQQFEMDFNPEAFAFGGAKLPEVEEAETPRALFEERVALLRDLSEVVDALFAAFLEVRCADGWEAKADEMREWAGRGTEAGEPRAAAA